MFKEVFGAVRNLYSLDQSEWQDRVRALDAYGLSKEWRRNRRLASLNEKLGMLEQMANITGFVLSRMVGSELGMGAFAASI